MQRPPRLPYRLLSLLCRDEELEDLAGDLDELFYSDLDLKGSFRAKVLYWYHAISLLFSYAVKSRRKLAAYSSHYRASSMGIWSSYLKISLRSLLKQKVFSVLNILGLALGMSVATLSTVTFMELRTFDRHHTHASQIYRLTSVVEDNGDIEYYASSPPALALRMTEQLTAIEKSVAINNSLRVEIEKKGEKISAGGYFAEPSFFELFSFPFKEGASAALNEPGTVILTQKLALKLFGERDALGEVLVTQNWGELKVVGVLEEFPKHTHFKFELVTNFNTSHNLRQSRRSAQWLNFRNNYYYFQLRDGFDEDLIESQLTILGAVGSEHFDSSGKGVHYQLQSLQNINLGPSYKNELGLVVGRADMTLFFIISLIILLPACFNYVNMSIARSFNRAKEIGIRKVLGSQKRQVVTQFIVETILISLIALVFSIYIFQLIREGFRSMLVIGGALTFDMGMVTLTALIGFAIITGIFTGIVPALTFAKTSPIQALRNQLVSSQVSISGVRKTLLVLQFISSLVLVTGIGVLLKQYDHVFSYNLGFNRENILVVPIYDGDPEIIRETFLKNKEVQQISFVSTVPGTPINQSIFSYFPKSGDSLRVRQCYADESFIPQMHLQVKWGNPIANKGRAIEQVMVNEKLMEMIKNINGPEGDSTILYINGDERLAIAGVVKNYNHEPLDTVIEPLLIRNNNQKVSFALISLTSDNLTGSLAHLELTWDELYPNQAFKSNFLHAEIERAYAYFKIYLKIFGFLATMALTVSCLGLLGMVIYSTENKIKEIAIRKILGANRTDLLTQLSSMYLKLWIVAVVIALPGTYFVFNRLVVPAFNKFSEGVGILELVLSVLVTMALAGSAIFSQLIKTTSINPVENLRAE